MSSERDSQPRDLERALAVLEAEIAQRKEAEDRLERLNAKLEERVAERTVELADARDTAQAASRAKSDFLANMSHEIRTPLNAVIGLTEVVLRSDLDDLQREQLSTVMDSAESLLTVIEDILDFSKVEAGKLELESVRFDLHNTIGDTLKSLSMRAQHKDLELACYLDPEVPRGLMGDPGRLRQVITNLVGNAIKFTEEGEVIVRVEPVTIRPGTATLSFSVRDTGIGIEADQLERLFDSFEQADSSSTRRYGGTGLGLAISRRLVSLLGGEILVESVSGEGSTFRFEIRFDLPERVRAPSSSSVDGLVGAAVLVVDDNATNRQILETITRSWGMRPALADSAAAGLRSLKEAAALGAAIPLVLSDVNMPEMDGFGFVEAIRADPAIRDCGVVLLTSGSASGDLRRCEALGIAGRVLKPAKQAELLAVVRRALGLRPVEENLLDIESSDPAAGLALPPLRILLTEDSIANQKVALAILQEKGHSIVVANNGREALETLGAADFDVVLMDVQMPELDGFAATAEIRREEDHTDRHLPIIAMTAHALQGDREKCLEAGMDDYISKPIRRSELEAVLARALDLPLGGSASQGKPAALGAGGRLVDWSVPLSQVKGDRDVLRGIVEAYTSESREQLALLPEHIDHGDHSEVRRRAHTLKAAMRMYGAETAQQLAQELENLGAAEDLEGAVELLERTRFAAEEVLAELDVFVETGELPPDA